MNLILPFPAEAFFPALHYEVVFLILGGAFSFRRSTMNSFSFILGGAFSFRHSTMNLFSSFLVEPLF